MRKKIIVVKSQSKNLSVLRKKIRPFLSKTDISKRDQWRFLVAITEACTNSMRHAYSDNSKGIIRVQAEDQKDRILIKIRDYGKKADIKKLKMPKLPRRIPHGIGLFFLAELMDEAYFKTSHKKGNEVILVKHKEGRK